MPDGRSLVLDAGVLVEPAPVGRLVLWVPGERHGAYQDWERVGTVVRAGVITRSGVCSIEVTSVKVRQRKAGALRRLLGGLVAGKSDRSLVLPNGAHGEVVGERRTDQRLVWGEEEAAPLDESRILAAWPASRTRRAIGRNVYLVEATGEPAIQAAPASAAPAEEPAAPHALAGLTPVAIAERGLAAAREAGDVPREITALTDLGVSQLKENQPRLAAQTLREALSRARRIGDRARAADAANNLAAAVLSLGRTERAHRLLQPVLAYARDANDRYTEKLAREYLAMVFLRKGERPAALGQFEHGASIAAELGDARHEARLLWQVAILRAELGHREEALDAAARSIDLLRRIGNPTAGWYAHHLANFQSASPGVALAALPETQHEFASSIDVSILSHSPPPPTQGAAGPGLLRMALSASKAMATFVGSGFKKTPDVVYRERLQVCDSCEHHTGVRCRLCGCITGVKARFLHERCPAGRWKA